MNMWKREDAVAIGIISDLWVNVNYSNYFQLRKTKTNDSDSFHLYKISVLIFGKFQKKLETNCITNFIIRLSKDFFRANFFQCLCLTIKLREAGRVRARKI